VPSLKYEWRVSMKYIISVLLIVFLSGCETLATRVTDEQLSTIDKVGLVSLIGDQISYSYVGLTAFNNKDTLYPFDGLEVDNYISTEISKALRRANPKVEIIPMGVELDELKSSYANEKYLASLDINKFINQISGKASQAQIRYVVVASRDFIQFDEAPVTVNGFGLRKRIGRDDVGSFVLIKFQLIDLLTKKELSKSRVFERDRNSDFEWKKPFNENSEAFKEGFKEYIYKSIDKRSRGIAATLIQSPKDFEFCAKKIYANGFDIDGKTYTTRESVIEVIRQYYRQKIVKEKVEPKKVKVPFKDKYDQKEEEVLDCIATLTN
jgi:hypothetical protein